MPRAKKEEEHRCGVYQCRQCGWKKYLLENPWSYCQKCDEASKFKLLLAVVIEEKDITPKIEACQKLRYQLEDKKLIKRK